jgi:small subunit ribosomal protein S9
MDKQVKPTKATKKTKPAIKTAATKTKVTVAKTTKAIKTAEETKSAPSAVLAPEPVATTTKIEKKKVAKPKKAHVTKHYYATGRRKSSSARVFMTKGKGVMTINGRPFENYFCNETQRMLITEPVETVGMQNKFDFKVTVIGGGVAGQAGAVRLGVARALLKYDMEAGSGEANSTGEAGALAFRSLLRAKGLLTRDPREVERKKVGLHKARKAPQYSKR